MELTARVRRMDQVTRVQYVLMVLFGGSCLVAAVAPLAPDINIVLVGVLFGITAGLWISHLIGVLHDAARQASLR